jgi:hypothetical protein
MPRRFSLAHALGTGQPNFPIQIHGENPPALPVARKGKGGRLLRRPQQAHPAATVADFRTAVLNLGVQTEKTIGALAKSEDDRSSVYRAVFEREQKADRLKSRLPWFGLGALVVALALTVTLPRFLASNVSTCAVLGASWTTTTTGVHACVFYQR